MRTVAMIVGLMMVVSASAGEAEICYSADMPLGSMTAPTNSTVFQCPVAGNKTLPQLAAAGWKIVQLVPVTTSGSTQANQLIIQR